jgi:hypothetical protein
MPLGAELVVGINALLVARNIRELALIAKVVNDPVNV